MGEAVAFLLTFLVLQVSAAHSAVEITNGTVQGDGLCLCSVVIPDNVFPLDRMEYLEFVAQNLTSSVQTQVLQVQQYGRTLSRYTRQLQNLTVRVQVAESGTSYTKLEFELLRVEIQELLSLTNQLRSTVSGGNTVINQLHVQIQNMSRVVDQLETYDTQNLLGFRVQIAALRLQLKQCQDNQELEPPQIEFGSCEHGVLVNVSKPQVVGLSWRGSAYKLGAWGRDPSPRPGKELEHWVAVPEAAGRPFYYYRVYPSFQDLLVSRNPTIQSLVRSSFIGQGSGMAVYKNHLYYNCYNSQYMCRVNLDTKAGQKTLLSGAGYNGRFSFAGSPYHDMDFSADESGVWVAYASEASRGSLLLSRIDADSFTVQRTWRTGIYQPSASNTFVVCGVLYAVRSRSTRLDEIFYAYDTRDGREDAGLRVPMEKVLERVSSVNYSPVDHKLFAFNEGYRVTYDVTFQPQETA